MASLTGNLVAETYKALLKTIDNDILTASEKQITDGFGGGSNVFIDSNGFLRANKYKVTNGLATQFLKADGSLDANTYLTSITSSQIITALGYTPVTNARTLTINGTTYDLSANRSWTIAGTAAVWGNISGTLSDQTDLQNALNAKFNNPTGTISQYIRGDGTLATFPAITGFVPYTGATQDVDLGTHTLLARDLVIDHASASGTAVDITKGGSGIAVNIEKSGSGEALTVVKSSGSGNAASITGGTTLISELHLTTKLADAYILSAATWNAKQNALNGTGFVKASGTTISYDNSTYLTTADAALTYLALTGGTLTGSITATSFIKTGGTSNEYLRADGSVNVITGDIISGSGTAGYLSKFNSSSVIVSSNLFESGANIGFGTITLNYGSYGRAFTGAGFGSTAFGFEAVTGSTTNGGLIGGLSLVIASNDSTRRIGSAIQSYISGATSTHQGADLRFFAKPDNGVLLEVVRMTSAGITFNKDLTAANINATTFVKSGGTASEFLMADGSVSTYTNPVTGTGSAGYIPKWTSASNLGQSFMYDDGTSIGIAYTTPNRGGYGRALSGASFGSASFGFEAVSNTTTNGGLIGGLSFIVNQNDSSRIVGSAIQSNLVGTTATNYGADLRFFAKADGVFTIAEVARMTSAGLRVYGTIIKDGGTSSQFLMADGSVTTGVANPVGGTGTTNYLSKWTSGSGIGNSQIFDNGTNIGIGLTSSLSAFLDIKGVASTIGTVSLNTRSGNTSTNFDSVQIALSYDGNTTYRHSIRTRHNDGPTATLGGNNIDFFVWKYGTDASSTMGTQFVATFSNFFNGSIGLGVDTPLTKLHVQIPSVSNTRQEIFRLTDTILADFKILLDRKTLLIDGIAVVNTAAGNMSFETSNAEKMRLFTTGNLLIGTSGTDAGFKLDVNGTGRFTSSVTATSFVRTSGTSTQFLKADGSVDSNTYLTTSGAAAQYQPIGSYATGSGSSSRLARWTSTTNLSVAQIWDDGTNIGIGQAPGAFKLDVTGTARITGALSGTSATFKVNTDRNLAIKYDTHITLSGQSDSGAPENLRVYADTFRIYTATTAIGLTERLSISNTGAATFSGNSTTLNINSTTRVLEVIGKNNFYASQIIGGSGIGTSYGLSINAGTNSSDIAFQVYNQAETAIRLFVRGDGNVGIGNTSPVAKLSVYSTSPSSVATGISVAAGSGGSNILAIDGSSFHNWFPYIDGNNYYSATNHYFRNGANGAAFGTINSTGMTAPAFFESSDIRLKTLIDGLAQIAGIENLEAKLYEKNGKIELGYFAQDAEKIMPYAVTKGTDGFLSLSYREVHTAKIARLEKEVAELKAQLNLN